MTIQGQGFPVEGVLESDEWAFNFGAPGTIYVSTDTGREVFEGNLGDAGVAVQGLEEGWQSPCSPTSAPPWRTTGGGVLVLVTPTNTPQRRGLGS